MMNDRDLDDVRDDLIASALEACPLAADAISVLFSAGFDILIKSVGPEHAIGAMQMIISAASERTAN
jgi:hypothetical protein